MTKHLQLLNQGLNIREIKLGLFGKLALITLTIVLRKAGKSFLSKHPLILKLLNVIISLIKVLIVDSFIRRLMTGWQKIKILNFLRISKS